MELLSGNLQIVEIGKINKKKKLEDMSRLTLRCQYIYSYIVCHSMFLIQNKYSFEI